MTIPVYHRLGKKLIKLGIRTRDPVVSGLDFPEWAIGSVIHLQMCQALANRKGALVYIN